MTDLTKITTPFGILMDEQPEVAEALRAHGGPYELWDQTSARWKHTERALWANGWIYRVKPQPPKPKEWWVKFDPVSEMFFQRTTQPPESAGYTLVREVLSDD